jgi:hypothetical protein
MTGDPHGRTAGKATLLVRAVDEIVGTHNVNTARIRAWRNLSLRPGFRSVVIAGMRSVRNDERNAEATDGQRLSAEQVGALKNHRWERNWYTAN